MRTIINFLVILTILLSSSELQAGTFNVTGGFNLNTDDGMLPFQVEKNFPDNSNERSRKSSFNSRDNKPESLYADAQLKEQALSEQKARLLKAGIEYAEVLNETIELRVTVMPTSYGMLERDLDGKVKPPEIGDEVFLENTESIKLALSNGEEISLPEGVRFTAKIKDVVKPKWWQRDGYIDLEFTELAFAGQTDHIEEGSISASTSTQAKSFKNKLRKVGRSAGYTVGGALAAPLIAYKIVGMTAFSDPIVTGSIAGAGATAGLAYSIISKGKLHRLEPGTKLKVKLKNNWLLKEAEKLQEVAADLKAHGKSTENYAALNKDLDKGQKGTLTGLASNEVRADQFDFKVTKVKKSRSQYDDPCLTIQGSLKNPDKKRLGYLSFKLINRMGRDFYTAPNHFAYAALNEEKVIEKLDLYFCVNYLHDIYTLEVRELDNYELLSRNKIVLK